MPLIEGKYGFADRTAAAVFAVAGAFLAPTPAKAAFTICNQGLDIANVAIGEASGEQIETRGWWVIAPNRCANVIHDDLKSRYVYVHATDVRGKVLMDGEATFCTLPRQFRIVGTKDCWQRGYTTGAFREIDTRQAKDWTLFLREDRNAPQATR